MQIPAATLGWWGTMGFEPATPDDIARITAAMGQPLPADYAAFLQAHGFVEWDIDIPDSFAYRLGPDHQPVVMNDGNISHLWPVKNMERMAASAAAGNPQPYPDTHFAIGGTPGQDQILMELSPTPGRIWFWPEREDPWGSGDNTELGYVAESFSAFIEGLQLGDM